MTRAGEHCDVRGERPSAVGKHIASCADCQQSVKVSVLKNFSVLRQSNKYEVELHEALLIKKLQPILNIQLFRSGANRVLSIFS